MRKIIELGSNVNSSIVQEYDLGFRALNAYDENDCRISMEARVKYSSLPIRDLFRDFPENGEGTRRDKMAILDDRFPISYLASAAVMAIDLYDDSKAYTELMKIFNYSVSKRRTKFVVRTIPEDLIGYVCNLVEDLSGSASWKAEQIEQSYGIVLNHYFGNLCHYKGGWSQLADTERVFNKHISQINQGMI